MKNLPFLVALLFSFSTLAQKELVAQKLVEYNLSPDFFMINLKGAAGGHFCQLKTSTIHGAEVRVEEMSYDPTREGGKRWTLKAVNGGLPTSYDLKRFNKTHNTRRDNFDWEIDDSSWGIEKEDSAYLIVLFKFIKSSLPTSYSFLGDCIGRAYFNKKTGKLEKSRFVSNGPVQIKFFKASNLDMIVSYFYNMEEGKYFVEKEDLDMDIKRLGQIEEVKEIDEYSGYRRVE